MALAFAERVRLAMLYAEKKPLSVTPQKPLSGADEVTAFSIALADADMPIIVSVVRSADSFTVAFATKKDGTPILNGKGIIHRGHAQFDAVERVRTIAKKPIAVIDDILGDKLDELLLA